MNLEYIEIDGLFYQKLKVENYKKVKNVQGKFANIKLNYLKNEEENLYNFLLQSNNLESYLKQIEMESRQKVEELFEKMSKNISENLKKENQLEWVGLMNNFKHCAEEIVINSLIN